MDNSSRFVPVGSDERLKFSRQLKLDDNRGIHMPANVSKDLAPFTDMAEIGRAPEEMSPGDLGGFSSSTGDRRDLASSVVGHSSSGKASAKRAGGRLRPVTVHSTPPRKRAPVIRRCIPTSEKYSFSRCGCVIPAGASGAYRETVAGPAVVGKQLPSSHFAGKSIGTPPSYTIARWLYSTLLLAGLLAPCYARKWCTDSNKTFNCKRNWKIFDNICRRPARQARNYHRQKACASSSLKTARCVFHATTHQIV